MAWQSAAVNRRVREQLLARDTFALLVLGLGVGCSSASPATSKPDAEAHDAGRDAPKSDDAHREASPSDAGHDAANGSRANGTLGAWQSLAAMPIPRANHCSVAAAGYLVVIGGNYAADGGFVSTDEIDVAALHADGSLGAWSRAGATPSPVNGCTAAASGSTIYLADGIYDDMSDQGHMFTAELSASGTLGAWTHAGALPNGQDAFYSNAWVGTDAAATLYVMDPGESFTSALIASTEPKLGAFSEDDWLVGFTGHAEYAFTGAYVYVMGGYLSTDGGNPTIATVSGAAVQGDKIGTPFTTTSLPAPVTFGQGVAVDDWIFVVGGKAGVFDSGEANTYSSEVGANGQLGPWTAQASLSEGRTDMALTLAGDFLYLTGGGYMGPGVSTVFSARVRF